SELQATITPLQSEEKNLLDERSKLDPQAAPPVTDAPAAVEETEVQPAATDGAVLNREDIEDGAAVDAPTTQEPATEAPAPTTAEDDAPAERQPVAEAAGPEQEKVD